MPHKADKLLTSQEMAERLSVSAQTFRRDVKSRNIPHIVVGKRFRFDPARVEAYLLAKVQQSNVVRLKLPKPARPQSVASRFAEKVNGDVS